MQMNSIYFLVQHMFYFAMPLLIVAMAGLFSERSGVINIALEGLMMFGAFGGAVFIAIMQAATVNNPMNPSLLLILALFVAGASGLLISVLHAFASINMKANQIISGTAINMLAPALLGFTARLITVNSTDKIAFSNNFQIQSVPLLGNIPVIGPLFFQSAFVTTYLGIAGLFVARFVLYKTRFGLRLRSCGEHPQAADSVGINVTKMRYAGVLISGALAGIGGLIFVIPVTAEFDTQQGVIGYGFLALAVLIFGQWKPYRILFAAFFFGILQTIAASSSVLPGIRDLPVNSYFYNAMPYIITIIVLAITSKKSQAPKAAGIPYDKGSR